MCSFNILKIGGPMLAAQSECFKHMACGWVCVSILRVVGMKRAGKMDMAKKKRTPGNTRLVAEEPL